MGQFLMWNYSVMNAMATVMLTGSSRIVLGMLDLWTYPDVRLANREDEPDTSTDS